jgi:UDP-glucose 4-epimerase
MVALSRFFSPAIFSSSSISVIKIGPLKREVNPCFKTFTPLYKLPDLLGSRPWHGDFMRILISGGAGFIASHVQDAYHALGHEVAVLDNLLSGKKSNLHPSTKFFELDIRSEAAAAALQEFRPEVLSLHAAQMDVRRSVTDPVYDCQVNGIGMLNLLEAGRKAGVKKFIFASSGGAVYGEQKYFPADEAHPTQPLSPYGITKLLGDKYLEFYRDNYGIPFVSLRYANVYGPRQNPHGEAGVVAIFTLKLLQGEVPTIFGDGLQTRDYVFIEDVVRANVLALEEKMSGIYNIGTGIETNVVEVYQTLAGILDVSRAPKFGPAKAGEQRRSVITSDKILREIGWAPEFKIDRGLKKTVAFFQEANADDLKP